MMALADWIISRLIYETNIFALYVSFDTYLNGNYLHIWLPLSLSTPLDILYSPWIIIF